MTPPPVLDPKDRPLDAASGGKTGGGVMVRVKLLIAYDGTGYAGWQRQRNARTIQAELECALSKLARRRVTVAGAGRTDAGVHAWGQVAHADLPARLTPRLITRALNAMLPSDIAIRHVARVPASFHARYGARRKWYRYRVWTGPAKALFERPYVTRVPHHGLDVPAMRRVARGWIGTHDFKAFQSNGPPVSARVARSTRRTIYQCRITRKNLELIVDIVANGFLYHMARRMVGALLEIGKGRRMPLAAPTAPARGLCLMEVAYV